MVLCEGMPLRSSVEMAEPIESYDSKAFDSKAFDSDEAVGIGDRCGSHQEQD